MNQEDVDQLLDYLRSFDTYGFSQDEYRTAKALVAENEKLKNSNDLKVKCTKLSKDSTSDWCLLETTQESLREHMKLLKNCYKENENLKSALTTKDSMLGIFEEQHEALTSKCEALELLIIDLNKKRVELSE